MPFNNIDTPPPKLNAMKLIIKICVLCLGFCFSNVLLAQYTAIPDPQFEVKLIDQGIDTEGTLDGQVLTDDIDHIILLDLDNLAGPTITDLTGIEDFIALEILMFPEHLVENIDLSNNINLKVLNCKFNNLISLDLTNNLLLEELDATNCFPGTCNQENLFTSLDLSNNPNLNSIFINYSNTLTELDLSNNPLLDRVGVSGNSILTSLNVKNGNNTFLESLKVLDYENGILNCIEVDDPVAATNASTPPYDMWEVDPGIIFSEDCTLSVQDVLEASIDMFPNPVKDMLYVSSTRYPIINITIYNVLGKKVISVSDNFQQIIMSQLPSGLYSIHIAMEEGVVVKKLLKE